VEQILHLKFVSKESQGVYGKEGNPSLDPIVFFKLELIAQLEGITYDRQLLRRINDSLSLRYFLKYNLDEPLPRHSTISRTRKRMPAGIYRKVFDYILKKCLKQA
jgi:transposase